MDAFVLSTDFRLALARSPLTVLRIN